MNKEIWKDITDYEGYYQVSNLGNVRRITKNGYKNVKGREGVYLSITLSKKCKKKSVNIHRLVAETFIPNEKNSNEVNHKNGNKYDNRVENLEWCIPRENRNHMIKELNKNPFGKKPRPVNKLDKFTGEFIERYESIADASRSLGTMNARSNITFVCQGYMKSAYGYIWEYAD